MSTITDLKRFLVEIHGKLLSHPTFVRQHGLGVDDPEFQKDIRDLDLAEQRLKLIFREIKSADNLLALKQQAVWDKKRDQRFDAASSVKTQRAELEELARQAKQVETLLKELIVKNGNLGEGEIAEGITKLIERLNAEDTHAEIHQGSHGSSYVRADQAHGVTVEGLTVLVFAALHAYKLLLKRREKAKV